jgi:hypothetical protein
VTLAFLFAVLLLFYGTIAWYCVLAIVLGIYLLVLFNYTLQKYGTSLPLHPAEAKMSRKCKVWLDVEQ